MNAKNGTALLIAFAIVLGFAPVSQAQDPASPQQSTDQQDKEKLTPEKKAVLLLDQSPRPGDSSCRRTAFTFRSPLEMYSGIATSRALEYCSARLAPV